MKKLRDKRKKLGFTLAYVSKHLGVAPCTYCAYEKGRRKPSFQTLVKLAKLYGCSVADFVDEAEEASIDEE